MSDNTVANLLATIGLTPEALQALASQVTQDSTEDDTTDEPSNQEVAEALATTEGLLPTKGRVYFSADAVKAAARVAKNGKPEVVTAKGGRATHVVLWLTDDGEVAAQNYYKG